MDTLSLAQRSAQVVWHPCTQMQHLEKSPVIPIVSAEGPWLRTNDGRELFDGIASWWTCLLGHRNPLIVSSIEAQLKILDHTMLAGLTHAPAVELSEALVKRTQGQLPHVSFASDGASALEIALKQSVHAWRNIGQVKKQQFICLSGSYHGETLGALGVTDMALFQETYRPLIHRALAIPGPDNREAGASGLSEIELADHALDQLDKLLQQTHEYVAAIVTEPLVQGARGMVMHHPHYLKGVRALTARYQVHWIADEIATGCGRTGRFFAVEHAGVWPDLLCLSKGLSGGALPLSVTLSSSDIFEKFLSEDVQQAFMHSHSFSGNPLACAAALGMLAQLDEDLLIANTDRSDRIFKKLMVLDSTQGVSGLRRQGMIFAFEVPDAAAVTQAALNRNLWIRPLGDTIYLMPPFLIDHALCDWLGEVLVDAVKSV